MSRVEMWAGPECTVNRVGNTWFNQLERSGHWRRRGDLELIADLGVRAVRYPALWEIHAPRSCDEIDWSWLDERLIGLRSAGIEPIAGLVHHGSGPAATSLVQDDFPEGLARYAARIAARFPWIEWYTPVNEPLTTARFSGLYGHWYPHGRDDRQFARALINQCRGIVLAMEAIRRVNSDAKLIQTDDAGTVYSTPGLRYQAAFENERRWITWDLLCGRVDERHLVGDFLLTCGISRQELDWFRERPCPPSIVGLNHYITSDRFLDERYHNYPPHLRGSNGRALYADTEAVRVLPEAGAGWGEVLLEAWRRYGLPLAATEVHIGCACDEQVSWLDAAWSAALEAREQGADVRAVTAWALFGSFDWDTLVTRASGHYEPGAFDVSSGVPRATALATAIRNLAKGRPVERAGRLKPGWWTQPERLLYPCDSGRLQNSLRSALLGLT
jgi:dTDP-4-dehydrorhamnose reductase